jgi:hypothetical protein
MNWYKYAKDGDTLHGQFMKREMERLMGEVKGLKMMVSASGPDKVLPRWKGEVRRHILLLPSLQRMPRMSMYELSKVSDDVESIREMMRRYDSDRFQEIMGDGSGNRQQSS